MSTTCLSLGPAVDGMPPGTAAIEMVCSHGVNAQETRTRVAAALEHYYRGKSIPRQVSQDDALALRSVVLERLTNECQVTAHDAVMLCPVPGQYNIELSDSDGGASSSMSNAWSTEDDESSDATEEGLPTVATANGM